MATQTKIIHTNVNQAMALNQTIDTDHRHRPQTLTQITLMLAISHTLHAKYTCNIADILANYRKVPLQRLILSTVNSQQSNRTKYLHIHACLLR